MVGLGESPPSRLWASVKLRRSLAPSGSLGVPLSQMAPTSAAQRRGRGHNQLSTISCRKEMLWICVIMFNFVIC